MVCYGESHFKVRRLLNLTSAKWHHEQKIISQFTSMSAPSNSLLDVWTAAASSPYEPAIPKTGHFALGFSLLSLSTYIAAVETHWIETDVFQAIILAGYFSLSTSLTHMADNIPLTQFRSLPDKCAGRRNPGIAGLWVGNSPVPLRNGLY